MDSISVDLQSLLEIQQYLLTNADSDTNWCSFAIEVLTFLVSVVMAILAGWAFVYTKREYSLHLAKEQANTLSHYNERYSSDENISKVVTYFIQKMERTSNITNPTTFEKEMFLRFFEELQFAIEQKAISKKIAYEMFSYYAIKAYEEGKLFVEDMFDGNWNRFCLFAKEMKRIKNKRK